MNSSLGPGVPKTHPKLGLAGPPHPLFYMWGQQARLAGLLVPQLGQSTTPAVLRVGSSYSHMLLLGDRVPLSHLGLDGPDSLPSL